MQLDSEEALSQQQEQGRSLLGSLLTFLSPAPTGQPPVLQFVTPSHHNQEASCCSEIDTPWAQAMAISPVVQHVTELHECTQEPVSSDEGNRS